MTKNSKNTPFPPSFARFCTPKTMYAGTLPGPEKTTLAYYDHDIQLLIQVPLPRTQIERNLGSVHKYPRGKYLGGGGKFGGGQKSCEAPKRGGQKSFKLPRGGG